MSSSQSSGAGDGETPPPVPKPRILGRGRGIPGRGAAIKIEASLLKTHPSSSSSSSSGSSAYASSISVTSSSDLKSKSQDFSLRDLKRIVPIIEQDCSSSDTSSGIETVSPASKFIGTIPRFLSEPHSGSSSPVSSSYESATRGKPVVDRGTQGTPLRVMSNVIKLTLKENKGVFLYHIDFTPSVDMADYRYQMVNQHLPVKRGIRCYDGGSQLYLPVQLENIEVSFNCKLPSNDSTVMSLKFVRHMLLEECVSLMSTLITNCTKELKLTRVGKGIYDGHAAKEVPQHKLQIWPGYVTKVQEQEDGVFLTCEQTFRVLRFESALSVLNNVHNASSQNFTTRALAELVGCTVITRYNNRMYRIDDIDWKSNPLSKFPLKSGGEISFKEYYKRQYNIDIRDLQQPLLLSKGRERLKNGEQNNQIVYLVPEICHLTGLTDQMRANKIVMKDIAMYTRLTPQQRYDGLKAFTKRLKENLNVRAMLEEWGLEVADGGGFEVEARVLDQFKLQFGKRPPVPCGADWARLVTSNPVFRAVDLHHWLLIFHQKSGRRADEFSRQMVGVAPGLGLEIGQPHKIPLTSDRIDVILSTLKREVNSNTQLVVVIMESQRDDVYGAIKKFCGTERPVPSQVVLSYTLSRDDRVRRIVQNIALQINVKLGGSIWTIPAPLRKTMVCGIDTYHDKTGNKSVGAFVATLDNLFTEYHSEAAFQQPGVELMNSLTVCMVNALTAYARRNGETPDRIVIYRDGVEESSMAGELAHEMKQLQGACRLYNPSYKPKFVLIVVLKRINTKYYTFKSNGDCGQAPPGSVVDHTITKRNFRDFFIVSQIVRHGTASPTHYVVIQDDQNMPIENIQKMTYMFCHLYYNWPGTVRVPAPCLYAHKLAQMVGQHMRSLPDPSVNNRLHYI